MTAWDKEFVDAEVPAYIDFPEDGLGNFQFGYVQSEIDWRESERDGKPTAEFSFEGTDDADECSGRGWAVVEGEKIRGMIFIHRGDESGFTAERC